MSAAPANAPITIDTNVLLYAHDLSEPSKRPIAEALVADAIVQRRLVLSVQVLNEFFWNATKASTRHGIRRPPILARAGAEQLIHDWAASVAILSLHARHTLGAVEAVQRHGLSFWDALLWATARDHGVSVIYTEDFQHGRDVDGVRFVNPFTAPSGP